MTENKSIEDKNSIDSGKKKGRSFALSAIIVGLGTFITKFSGLLRQIVVADRFSQGIYRDSFDIAFTLPDLVFNLLIGGAIYSTIAPFLSALRALGTEKEAVKTVSIFISVVSVVMIFFCTLGTVFSEQFYSLYALNKNTNPITLQLAAQASKMLFPQISSSRIIVSVPSDIFHDACSFLQWYLCCLQEIRGIFIRTVLL